MFTLRNNPFREVFYFDYYSIFVFYVSFVILVASLGFFLQAILADTVRNVFIFEEESFTDLSEFWIMIHVKNTIREIKASVKSFFHSVKHLDK